MPSAVARYVVSLAVLLAAYGLYALAAVPLIEPQARYKESSQSDEPFPDRAGPEMERQREELSSLFPEGAWEHSSPKVLATEQGKLLFSSYEPQPDGRMKLMPCSLVFYVGGSASGERKGRPIVMRAPAAFLQFERPMNLGQSDMGRLIGGRLEGGAITITSDESQPGANDELEIITRDLNFDEEHVWTPNAVKFRFGESYGSGADLSIALVPRGKPGDKKLATGTGGIRSLELVHLAKLHLVTSGGGLLPGSAEQKPSAAEPPLPVEVMCQGPFRFDFSKLVASFEDQVDVRRLHPQGDPDTLTCELLEIYFGKGEKAGGAAESPAAASSTTTALSGLEVQRLVAVGQPVELKSAGDGASATGQRFEYDVRNRRILLEDPKQATLEHGLRHIEARGMAYELADPGKLGRLWAAGPGRFRSAASADGKQQFEATWAKELRLRPHQGNHVLSLSRGASLSFSAQGDIRADDIHIWLHEAAPQQGAPLATQRPGKPVQPSVVPDKLLALGNVVIDSQQLSGRSPRLEAWFKVDEVVESASSGENPKSAAIGPQRNGAIVQPPSADEPQEKRPPQKFDITGQLIQIQLVRRGSQTAAENVTVDGQVKLVELQSGIAKTPPFEMQGDMLQLFQASSPNARVRVTGQPARVSARGMKLAGDNIQMHRGENQVWIDGPGEMTLPAQRNPLAAMQPGGAAVNRAELPRSPLAAGQTITVVWLKRMVFDGRTVRFEKQVEARGDTQYARGELLEVTLNRRFDFSQPQPTEGLDVQRLAFDGGVFLENRTLEQGRVASIEQLQVKRLSLDNQNGRLHGVGPGWVTSIRMGGMAPPGSPGDSPAARSLGARADGKLNYLHVEFQTAITGNLVQREVQFLDRVVAVYGPISDWQQQLSLDRIDELPEQAVLMNCDRLTVLEMGQTGQGQKLYEMEAAGNSRVEGKTFTATAERMTYAQAKDLIVLEGDGRADAELWRQTRVGGPAEHAAARKILFWQRENRAQVDDARFLDLSQFGAPPPRKEAPK